MSNVLILNNSHSEYDLIENFLKLKNFKVFTTGNRQPFVINNIKHYKIDYTNIPKIEKIKKKEKINLIISCANDLGLYSSLKLKKNKLIDSKKTLNNLLNKFSFRKYYKEIPYYQFGKKISNNNYPILLKKKISSGGKNIYKINNFEEFHKIKVKKKDYFFEKFIEGTNHGVFTIIKDKKILFSFFDNEQRFTNPYTVSSTSSCTNIPVAIQKKFLKEILKIVLDLKLVDGILHFQIKYNKLKKKIYIIEITRRIPGDRYMKFVEYATGINVCKLYIDLHLNKNLFIQKNTKKKFILRKIIFAKKNGKFLKFIISNKIKKNIIETTFILKKNEVINDYMNQRLAICFFKFRDKKLLVKFTNNIDKFIKIKFK